MPDDPIMAAELASPGRAHKAIPAGPTVGPGAEFGSDFDYWIQTGRWEHVTSSNVAAIASDSDSEELKVRFRNGDEWKYSPVPVGMAASFYKSGSKGGWIFDNIRMRGKGNAKRHQVNAQRL